MLSLERRKELGITEYMVERREQENTAWENMSMARETTADDSIVLD